MRLRIWISVLCLLLISCDEQPWNSPYSEKLVKEKILFSSFAEQPKTLDPVKAYSSNEYTFLNLIYEPPLTYDYLKRPYTLKPNTLESMPTVEYLDINGQRLAEGTAQQVAYSRYTLTLREDIQYQPHPAFARKAGKFVYGSIDDDFLDKHQIESITDFALTASRRVTADDYIYQIKRLADPKNHSPIASLMAEHIVGFKDFSEQLQALTTKAQPINLQALPLAGVQALNKKQYQITIKGQYPQFLYWLAMPFFAPMPPEAIAFYQQPGMRDRNITLSWFPVGSGPFMLQQNNPNRAMRLVKNPHYHDTFYPRFGSEQDKAQGYLKYAGRKLPMYDQILFSLEKETIPRWNKFLQGYYDFSGVNNDSFDQAITVTKQGKPLLTETMKQQHISLSSSTQPSIFYMGFNMLDDVVGGDSQKARYLRQAISIAVNYEEYISIFLNGRGRIAQGPIPPGIDGYQQGAKGLNPYVFHWQDNAIKRRNIKDAQQLMAKAGYPNGRSQKTGQPLILNYDAPASSGPEEKAYFNWLRKQFAKLGISLNIRATQYNRFQQKMRTGKAQIFSWGWNADYPDPENFLFLFLTKNGKVKYHGENAANYSNKAFDALFERMQSLAKGKQRDQVIHQMVAMLQKDAPWLWGFYPKSFVLKQAWLSPTKPASIGPGNLLYLAIDTQKRMESQQQWNQPVLWPLIAIALLILFFMLPISYFYYVRIHKPRKQL